MMHKSSCSKLFESNSRKEERSNRLWGQAPSKIYALSSWCPSCFLLFFKKKPSLLPSVPLEESRGLAKKCFVSLLLPCSSCEIATLRLRSSFRLALDEKLASAKSPFLFSLFCGGGLRHNLHLSPAEYRGFTQQIRIDQ